MKGTFKDFYTGYPINPKKSNPAMAYDFYFRKKDHSTWLYVNSSNDLNAFKEQKEAVVSRNSEYLILDAKTGKKAI